MKLQSYIRKRKRLIISRFSAACILIMLMCIIYPEICRQQEFAYERYARAENYLNKSIMEIANLKDFETNLYELQNRYISLTRAHKNHKILGVPNLIRKIENDLILHKFPLVEYVNITLNVVHNPENLRRISDLTLNNYEIKLDFYAVNIFAAMNLINHFRKILPESTSIINLEIFNTLTLTPDLVINLNEKRKLPPINVKIRFLAKEIGYKRVGME